MSALQYVVLCVDDNSDHRFATAVLLRAEGYRVLEADGGAKALDLVRQADLVILDVRLPDLDGFEVCRRVKTDSSTALVPVILLSGVFTRSEDKAQGLEGGADVFLTKPVEPRELLGQVKALLRIRQTELALLRSEQRYRSLLDSVPEEVWTTGADGTPTYFNQRWAWYTGLSLTESLAAGFGRAIHPDDLPVALDRFGESLQSGQPYEAEYRLRRADGAYRWHLSRALPMPDGAGGISGWCGTCTDIEDRKEAQGELAESHALLETLLGNAPVGFAFIDTAFRYVRVNTTLANFVGRPAGELVGRTVAEAVPDLWPRLEPIYRRVLAAGRPEAGNEVSGQMLGEPGRVRHFLVSHYPVHLQGRVVGIGVVVNDVTERVEAEEANARLAAIIAGSDDAIIGGSLDGRITTWNPGAERLYGYTAAEVIGTPLTALTPPDLLSEMQAALERARRGELVSAFDTVRVRKDGTRVDVSVSVSPVRDRDGRVVAITRIAHNISERKRAERERAKLLNRLRLQVERMPIGFIVFAPDLTYTEWNPAAEQIFGFTREEALGKTCFDLGIIPNAAWPYVEDILRRLFLGDMAAHGVNENRRRDGQAIRCEWYNTPLKGPDDAVEAVLSMVIDVTEKHRLEDQFRQAQKMEAVGRLAGGVAHDFNNLLTIISGYSDILLAKLPADSGARALLGQIRDAGERAASLTRQLLAFSRKTVLEPKVLDVNALVRDLSKLLKRLIGEDVDLATRLAPDLGRVKADPGQLEQALINLAVNARDAMPTGGKLTIETHNVELDDSCALTHPEVRPGPCVLIAVSDTGHGMDEATRARIFEPFFTTKEEGRGTGLGLAMVYGFVQQSGGHVTVTSEPGQGATFHVYLPRIDTAVTSRKSDPGLTRLTQGNETVLLAEDEGGLRVLTGHVLRAAGYTVLEAADGQEAVRIAPQHAGPIHLLITDVVMPRMSGRQVAEALRRLHPEMKVLYTSGYTEDAVVRHGILEEQVAFLQKPYSPAALAAKVREVLDSPSA